LAAAPLDEPDSTTDYRRLLFESPVLAIIYHTVDGTVTRASAKACEVLGLTHEQIIGRSVADPRLGTIGDDGSDLSGQAMPTVACLRTGEPVVDVPIGVQSLVTKKFRWFQVTAIPDFGPDGVEPVGALVVFSDITERREKGRRADRLLDLISETTHSLVFAKDLEGRFLFANKRLERLFGAEEGGLIGKVSDPLVGQESAEEFIQNDRRVAESGETLAFEETGEEPDGTHTYLSVKSPLFDEEGRVFAIAGVAHDITARKRLEEQLRGAKRALEEAHRELQQAFVDIQGIARIDELTRINNRRYWYELAEREFSAAKRYSKPLSVILFDVDCFKSVNDTYGHTVGDTLLEHIASAASAELRSADIIGRYGGEEFVIALPMTPALQAHTIAQRILEGVEAVRVEARQGSASATISIGIAEMVDATSGGRARDRDSLEALVNRADHAMYAAKSSGRNGIRVYSPRMGLPGGET